MSNLRQLHGHAFTRALAVRQEEEVLTDALGYRLKLAIIAPSTNTIVQPEMDDMRVPGVTNHFGRIYLPDNPIGDDADFSKIMVDIRREMDDAVRSVLTAQPDRLVLGISSESFWGGVKGAEQLKAEMLALTGGVPVTMGSDAIVDALRCYPQVRKVAVVTPYMPVGDEEVRRFFEESGFEVAAIKGLRCASPVQIAHVPFSRLRDAIVELSASGADAIVQVGTNLSMARLAATAEQWLDIPVLAINSAIYWHALRNSGIQDRIFGFGSLFTDH